MSQSVSIVVNDGTGEDAWEVVVSVSGPNTGPKSTLTSLLEDATQRALRSIDVWDDSPNSP